MRYRLDQLATLAADLGLEARRVDDDRLDVALADAALVFRNLPGGAGSLVGFDGTPWHAHDRVPFVARDGAVVEYDELELLLALACGELVIVTRRVHGQLGDRWLAHRDEHLDLRDLEPGEELRALRLPASNGR